MTQNEKELLLKDLCARLPYGVKVYDTKGNFDSNCQTLVHINGPMCEAFVVSGFVCRTAPITDLKPYLFPLSSMTKKQYESLKESGILDNCSHSYEYINSHINEVSFMFKEFKTYSLELIDWLNKNKFDYRRLIPMGLAIDATNLNIY